MYGDLLTFYPVNTRVLSESHDKILLECNRNLKLSHEKILYFKSDYTKSHKFKKQS